ncbi:MAG: hypothetical protein HIU85_09565 [Proteobacteria bacterium]|nr:hypothetical protein [Pseudomonadota bacterium]
MELRLHAGAAPLAPVARVPRARRAPINDISRLLMRELDGIPAAGIIAAVSFAEDDFIANR